MVLAKRLERLEELARTQTPADNPLLAKLRADPTGLMLEAGLVPDQWQATLLRSPSDRTLILCSRQAGKSTTAAALALKSALLEAPALVLLLSPTLRQSAELFVKVMELYSLLGRPVPTQRPRDNVLKMELVNGSRVVSLPGTEASIRGYSSVRLLIVDEAARVPDPLYFSVRPMLAVSGGRLVALSTPFGRRGFFHDAWHGRESWQRVRVTAAECPRIPREFLAEEERALGARWYRQEYCCSFEADTGSLFAYEDVQAALADDLAPLFEEG